MFKALVYGLVLCSMVLGLSLSPFVADTALANRECYPGSWFEQVSRNGWSNHWRAVAVIARRPIDTRIGKWNIAANTKHVVFVPGNLTIDVQNASTNADQQDLINVPTGSFLGFIVGGNITVSENVGYNGNANLDALQTPNVEVFLLPMARSPLKVMA